MDRNKWIRSKRVAEHLGLDRQLLRALMRRTPVRGRIWVDVGLGRAPRYRWESLDAADAWLKSVGRSHE